MKKINNSAPDLRAKDASPEATAVWPLTTVRSLSVVVPVYNSEANLPLLIERLESVLASLGLPYEAILVNDGSRDRSWERICELTRGQELAGRH